MRAAVVCAVTGLLLARPASAFEIPGAESALDSARAYCVMIPADRWVPDFPGPIPVYVSIDSQTGLRDTGVADYGNYDPPDVVPWVKAAITIVNEASHDGPRLYYAGTDPTVPHTGANYWLNRAPGITISTFGPCTSQPSDKVAGFHRSGNKGAIRMIRGTGGADFPNGDDHSCPMGGPNPFVWWTDPGDDDPVGTENESRDFVGTLVHEFLHALGLDHTDGPGVVTCDPMFDPQVLTANSTMYVPDGEFERDFRRRLRRDDVEGLRALWGEPERAASSSTSTLAEPTPASWSAAAGLAAVTANTPVTLSNASRNNDDPILLGFTNAADEVRYLTGVWSGWGGASTKVPHPSGGGATIYSYDSVAVARGRKPVGDVERRIVAWHGTDESTCCDAERVLPIVPNGEIVQTRVWWRVYDGAVWRAPSSTLTTRSKELGVGYDPRTDNFVLAHLDTCVRQDQDDQCRVWPDRPKDQWLRVRTVSASTGATVCEQIQDSASSDHLTAVGSIACDHRSIALPTRCVIPFTTVDEFTGPQLGLLEGEIKPVDGVQCFVRMVDPSTTLPVLAVGTPSAALDGYLTAAQGSVFVGAWGSAAAPTSDDWSRIFTLDRTNPAGWVVAPVQNETLRPTLGWPVAVGSQTRTTGAPYTRWRAISY